MKKLFFMLAFSAMILGFTACGDDKDEPQPDVTKTITIDNIVTKTVSGSTGTAFDVNSSLELDINYTQKLVNVVTKGVKFSPNQPITIDLTFNDCAAICKNENYFSLNGTGFTPMDGYSVNDVEGSIDLNLKTVLMKYTVVSTRTTSQIYAFSDNLYGNLPANETTLDDITDTYYKFHYGITADNTVNANVHIYNIRFVEEMPKLAEIRIPLSDATITTTPTGYTIEGSDIIPFYMQGQTEVPMSSRPITNLKLDVNVENKTFHIEFDCYGLHVSNDGNLNV